MKRILLFAAFLGIASAMTAQNIEKCDFTAKDALEKVQTNNRATGSFTEVLDSIVYTSEWNNYTESYQYDWQGRILVKTTCSEWENERLVNAYEGDLLKTIEHLSRGIGLTEWEHSATEIYTYDENDNLVLFEYNAFNFDEWMITDRYEYTYDEQNRLKTSQTWWYDFYGVYGEPQLVPGSREEYTYTETTVTIDMYSYFMEDEEWHPSSRIVNTISEYGGYSETVQMLWSDESQDYVNDYKNSYSYDAAGNITAVTNSRWENGEWNVESQMTAEYEDGLLVATTNSDIYTTGSLSPYLHDEYEYDAAGNRNVVKNFYYENGELIQSSINECEYDMTIDADEIMGCQAAWNSVASGFFTCAADPAGIQINNKWTKLNRHELADDLYTIVDTYYSAASGVDEDGEEVRIHVAGLDGRLFVRCDEPSEISVFDVSGRVVAMRSNISECEISLNAGMYIVKAGKAAVKVVVR